MSFITLDKNKKRDLKPLFLWCRRRDSNPQGVNHTNLNRARLPIPPLRHFHLPYFIQFSICSNFVSAADVDSRSTLSENDTQSFSCGRVPLRHFHLPYFIQFSICSNFVSAADVDSRSTLSENDTQSFSCGRVPLRHFHLPYFIQFSKFYKIIIL